KGTASPASCSTSSSWMKNGSSSCAPRSTRVSTNSPCSRLTKKLLFSVPSAMPWKSTRRPSPYGARKSSSSWCSSGVNTDMAALPAEDFPGGDQHVGLVGAYEVVAAVGAHQIVRLTVLGRYLDRVQEAVDPEFLDAFVALLADGDVRFGIHRILGRSVQRQGQQASQQQVIESAHGTLCPDISINRYGHSSAVPAQKVCT